jgi:glycosyltransferase involved in cell wall biosynthesis
MEGIVKMHIVFVTTELATMNHSSGGLASFTANMARIFAKKGHKVTILLVATTKETLIFDEEIALEMTYVKKTIWNMFDTWAKWMHVKKENPAEIRRFLVNLYKSGQVKAKIKEIDKKEKIDIVHYCNLGALALRASSSIPYVIRISSFMNMCQGAELPDGNIGYEDNKPSIKDRLTEYTLKKARYTISPSNLLADIGRRYLGIESTVLESPFVLKKEEWNYDIYDSIIEGKKYILHYGSLRYAKGTHVVAQLAEKLLRGNPDVYLVLAGNSEEMLDASGNKIKAHELVKKSAGQYADRVVYAGRLVREQLYPIVQKAEVCVLPSRIENLSNACIEAMAMGKIVVATNGASYEQLIEDRISGFLCERDNAESFLQGLGEALRLSSEEKEGMSARAMEITKRLAPEKIYANYMEFYKKVIEEW